MKRRNFSFPDFLKVNPVSHNENSELDEFSLSLLNESEEIFSNFSQNVAFRPVLSFEQHQESNLQFNYENESTFTIELEED